jgi:hypothetical protein
MACWVVPSLAAEFWSIPVAQVLEKIRTGELISKTELGFTLVDVAPCSPRMVSGRGPKAVRPSTFVMTAPATVLTPAEKRALAEDLSSEEAEPVAAEREETWGDERLDWRPTRLAVSRQRRAPQLAA